jgi:hypothetical protein
MIAMPKTSFIALSCNEYAKLRRRPVARQRPIQQKEK